MNNRWVILKYKIRKLEFEIRIRNFEIYFINCLNTLVDKNMKW